MTTNASNTLIENSARVAANAGGGKAPDDLNGLLWVLGIILIAGLVGGLGARLRPGLAEPPSPQRAMLLGVIAAACVPLFLSLVQSQLIESFLANRAPGRASAVLVLIGFCLLAAVYADSFLASLSKRVLAQLEETKKTVEQAERVAREATEKAEVARRDIREAVLEARSALAKEPG